MKWYAAKLLSVSLVFYGLLSGMRTYCSAQDTPAKPFPAGKFPLHLADYDAEPRLSNGRIDVERLADRLKALGATTYYFLVLHAAADWDDLKLFLPLAARNHLAVWVYLVPPSESPPVVGNLYSEPYRLDFPKWAEEIAKLSLEHTNLTAWVIDDFFINHALFTPTYVRAMQQRAKQVNPRLAFLPLMYFNEMSRSFVQDYHDVIDGVVVAYPPDRTEIDRAWAVANDAPILARAILGFPHYATSRPGDFVSASQPATVISTHTAKLRFREREDYTGPTSGYHFKQLLINGNIVWEEDVAGGTNGWREVTIELPPMANGKIELAFRLFDKQGVGNFGVQWQLADFKGEGVESVAPLEQPERWQVKRSGAFEAGFGEELSKPGGRWHLPFVVMTAAQEIEFRLRHGEPASLERRAVWVEMCMQAMRDGKCDGVVTYCLDKEPASRMFTSVAHIFAHAQGR